MPCKIIISLCLLFVVASNAQAPDTLWTRTYGGPELDYAYSVQQTSDGQYIVVGTTESFGAGHQDIWLLKLDTLGDTLWARTNYGGSLSDGASDIKETSDKGFIIVGFSQYFSVGESDVYLLKTDSLGNLLWRQFYGGTEGDYGHAVQQTDDGGYIIVGRKGSAAGPPYYDIYLIKTNATGETLWTRTYGGAPLDEGNAVQQTSDGGYIVTGRTDSYGQSGLVWLLKITPDGDTTWTRTYGGGSTQIGYSVLETNEGDYITLGWTGQDDDVYVIKTDSSGNTLWERNYGSDNLEAASQRCYCVQPTAGNCYIMAGRAGAWGESTDVYLLKINTQGDSLWAQRYGATGVEDDEIARCVYPTYDEGYVIAGYANSFGSGSFDFYIIKTCPDTLGIAEEKQVDACHKSILKTIIGGPLQLPAHQTCRVFDITGRVVVPDKLGPGIYFIEVDDAITRKVVKVR